MLYQVCKTKIKGARVTDKKLYYDGSITIPKDILKAAGIKAGDIIDVLNLNNGARITTYVIEGKNHGEICLNGPAARFFEVGDEIIILQVCFMTQKKRERSRLNVISLSEKNEIITVEAKNARNEKSYKKV